MVVTVRRASYWTKVQLPQAPTRAHARHRSAFSRKTAVLCPTNSFDNARFFAYCAENRGFNEGLDQGPMAKRVVLRKILRCFTP